VSDLHDQICPWCQTEIVWDPELGPEEACPHCFNELGDYRSISLKLKNSGQNLMLSEEDEEEYESDMEAMDDYEEGVQRLLDQQEEAPECPSCHSFMLFAGTQSAPQSFLPFVHGGIKQPLLKAAFSTNVYVCPSCFKLEQIVSEPDRLELIEKLKIHGQEKQQ
jgi:hypothetical protein